MTIKVYPSRLDGEPLETHETFDLISIEDWLCENVKTYKDATDKPLSITINGLGVPQNEWGSTFFSPSDEVRMYVEPRGLEAVIIGVIAALAVSVILRQQQTPAKPADRPQAKTLGDPGQLANTVRFGEPIPEIAGSPLTYPDYIMPPRRYYQNQTEQWVGQLLCVGKGEYFMDPSQIFLGETSAPSLGDDIQFAFFKPGEIIPPEMREWWHTPEEVGFTSFGGAGLSLESTGRISSSWGTAWTFQGASITSNAPVPTRWELGFQLVVQAEVPVEFNGDHFTSDFLNTLNIEVGDIVQITGSREGSYPITGMSPHPEHGKVRYYSAGVDFGLGLEVCAIGRDGLLYTIVAKDANTVIVNPVGVEFWTGFTSDVSDGTSYVELSANSREVGWTGPFTAVPRGEQADALEVDLFFPQGLVAYDKKNRKYGVNVRGNIQWRYLGDSAWNNVPFSYSALQVNQMGRTYRIDLPEPGRVEVRVRRTPKNASTGVYDEMQWSGLRARLLGAPEKYDGITTCFIRVRSGDKISGATENKISIRAQRILPTIEDPSVSVATRDVMPFFVHMMNSVGYGGKYLDMPAIYELHKILKARGDTFDIAFDGLGTLKTAASYCLGVSWCELTLKRGLISVVRDAAPLVPVSRVFSPQEYTKEIVEMTQTIMPDEIDGVDVEYTDYRTGRTVTEPYRLFEDKGLRVQTIKAPGVTNRTQAWRIAARRRREVAYRRTLWSGQTEMAAMNCQYLDYVGLQDGVYGYGQSAFIVSVDGRWLTLSEEIRQDGVMILRAREESGKSCKPIAIEQISGNRVRLSSELPFTPIVAGDARQPTTVAIGLTRNIMHHALITEIRPTQDGKTDFKAKIMDLNIYADDDSGPNRIYLTSLPYNPILETSWPYPIFDLDEMKADRVIDTSAVWRFPPIDSTAVKITDVSVSMPQVVNYLEYEFTESTSATVSDIAVELKSTTIYSQYAMEYESTEPKVSNLSINLETVAIGYDMGIDSTTATIQNPIVNMVQK